MGDGGRDFWHELSGLADGFADLGRRMLHASRQLHSPGALPPEALLAEVDGLRRRFESLRDAILDRARALDVPAASEGAPGDLKGLARLLDAVGEAEARREQWGRRVGPALAVLDRVLGLEHVAAADFAPLRACQEQARALRQAIAEGPTDALADQVAGLAAMDHPFAYLILMVEGAERVSDDLWESLFDAVAATFGKSLAAAAGRARVVERGRMTPREATAAPVSEPAAEAPTPLAAILSAEPPTVTVAWASGRPAPSPWRLDVPFPAAPAGPAEGLFTSAVTPVIPKRRSSVFSGRRLVRTADRKAVPQVESLEAVRLLSGATISSLVAPDVARPTAATMPTNPDPAGPGWAFRFPRLAARRGLAHHATVA